MNIVNSLWCEAYRPKNIDDTILPKSIKDSFKSFVKSVKKGGTFKAYRIEDDKINTLIKMAHKKGNPYLADSGF